MSYPQPIENTNAKKRKPYYKRPDGIVGTVFLLLLLGGGIYGLYLVMPALISLAENALYLTLMLLVLAALLYMIFDPRMRTLIGYMYKSTMRSITSWFITIDPIGILKNYVSDLEKNLSRMSEQIGGVRGQIHKLSTLIEKNEDEVKTQLAIASKAKEKDMDKQMVLASRKAARLKDSNEKYQALHKKLEVLHRVLSKMHGNSEILLEDTRDQIKVKEEERKAIRASHSAMQSAMNVIQGDSDKRVMFDEAIEVIAEDVAHKVGEMERFMELSSGLMDSIDLQQGVFEDQGLKMLEEWEKESSLMFLDEEDSVSDEENATTGDPNKGEA
jgi:predicted  nucleic acid-binding Zn-ribbon protein